MRGGAGLAAEEPAVSEARPPEPRPSATVVLLRDGPAGLELLLLQRAAKDGKPGAWVFPGGKVEPGDVEGGAPGSQQSALRAAVRETHEEAGLALEPARLAAISRWITPELAPQRFDTWFFAGVVDTAHEVVVCGSECVAHRWLTPAAALAAQASGELSLAPPTFVTVTWLAAHARADEAVRDLAAGPFITFRPRIHRGAEGVVMLYPGDAGYEANDPAAPGARHRIHAQPDGWRYERS
jgi:8-oxo-dGTP pyrophosphatase MutT (NUDIX family)